MIINEIMYHPSSEDSRDEYIEIHNTNTFPVALQGWRLAAGIQFSFLDGEIPAGGFWVVAADFDLFRQHHPGITNVSGHWDGQLSNHGEAIALVNPLGQEVDRVRYADDGDWAPRIRDVISYGHRGWKWQSPADGGGHSLERINPTLPGSCGQNWMASRTINGTPGEANSSLDLNTAPLLLNPQQYPIIPRSTDPVAVSVHLVDEAPSKCAARVWYRLDGQPKFAALPMADDGAHGDGAPRDGVYGAFLPPQTNQAIVEFYLEAQDETGQLRSWPAPALDDGMPVQVLNALYQVVDSPEADRPPVYRLILRATDAAELKQINLNYPAAPFPTWAQSPSDAKFNATFVSQHGSHISVRHNVAVCNRGNGSCWKQPQSYRVNFLDDEPWQRVVAINLNSQYPILQTAGSAIYRHVGLPVHLSRLVQLRVNGRDLSQPGPPSFGVYACNEVLDSDFVNRNFPNDASGNLYEGVRVEGNGANLAYLGSDPDAYRTNYFKRTNASEDDWSDLFHLTEIIDTTQDQEYDEEIERNLDVRQWMRYFAIDTLAVNMETSLGNGHLGYGYGDDYFLYLGQLDPRAILIPHDLDTILGQGDTPGRFDEQLFRAAANPRISRLLKAPAFAPIYFEELLRQMDRTFSAGTLHPLLDQAIGGIAPDSILQAIKAFMADRCAYVRAQIPQGLLIATNLPSRGGYLYTLRPQLDLHGYSHAVRCRSVEINGKPAAWSAWEGKWALTKFGLHPGINRLAVECRDANGIVFEKQCLEVWFDNASSLAVPAVLTTNTTWDSSTGPYLVNHTLAVPEGIALRLKAGTTVFFAAGTGLKIEGQLHAEGNERMPVFLGRIPGQQETWNGIQLAPSSSTHHLSHLIIEGAGSGQPLIRGTNTALVVSHISFTNTAGPCISLEESSFSITASVFPGCCGSNVISAQGIPFQGFGILESNVFGAATDAHAAVQITRGQSAEAIVQVTDNRFMGASVCAVTVRGVAALFEGNWFQNVRSTSPANPEACAIAGVSDAKGNARLCVTRNFFIDCDQAVNGAGCSQLILSHNTGFQIHRAVIETRDANPSDGTTSSVPDIQISDNIFWESPTNLTALVGVQPVSWENNILSTLVEIAAGSNNWILDPAFLDAPENMTGIGALPSGFRLRSNSPAMGTGSDGLDRGAHVPRWACVSGLPASPTRQTNLSLRVGGPGVCSYRFRLNDGELSASRPVSMPIELRALTNGIYWIQVFGQNYAGIWQSEPFNAPRLTIDTQNAGVPKIRINEILAANRIVWKMPSGFPDLVELHNYGDETIDLSGMSLSDDPSMPARFVVPALTSLPARGFLVLASGTVLVPGAINLGFGLSQNGDAIYLWDTDQNGRNLIDSVVFGKQIPDLSISRLPQGGWGLSVPTLGAPNIPHPVGDPAQVRINEWRNAPRAGAEPDFVELFNPCSLPVHLGGITLLDHNVFQLGTTPIPELTFVAPQQTILFVERNPESYNALALPFELLENQGAIGLFDSAQNPVDLVFHDPEFSNLAQGRSPDGGIFFATFAHPSPGSRNPNPVQPGQTNDSIFSGLVLNEVFACGLNTSTAVPLDSDWVELHNTSTNSIDLAELSLTDTLEQPRKWLFPTPSFLASGAFYMVLCNNALLPSMTNTGFGLRASGDSLYLLRLTTGVTSILDSISFGQQSPPWSVGRVGSSSRWALSLPSPGADNMAVTLGDPALVRINEWMAQPAVGGDWIELFNASTNPVSLEGLYLTDNLEQRSLSPISPLSFIGTGSNAFAIFLADNEPLKGADHVAFKLDADGESIGLFDAFGRQIDAITFFSQIRDVSQGRFPDGDQVIVPFARFPSPGLPNLPDSELADSDQDGMPDYWESVFGLNPMDSSDALTDADGDSINNELEYLSGTNPCDASSQLRLLIRPSGPRTISLQFSSAVGKIYQIEFRNNLESDPWHYLKQLGPFANGGFQQWIDLDALEWPARYYRITPVR